MMSSRRRFWGPQQRSNMRTRQRMAPQPDQQPLTGGMTPNQVQQRTLPGSSPGVMAVTGGRRQTGQKAPLPAYTNYLDELDLDKSGKGLSNPQVQWLKKNMLGRPKGQRGPNEGIAFQRELAKSIQAAGGLQAFIASMGGMPGVTRRQAMATERTTPNTFAPGQVALPTPNGGQTGGIGQRQGITPPADPGQRQLFGAGSTGGGWTQMPTPNQGQSGGQDSQVQAGSGGKWTQMPDPTKPGGGGGQTGGGQTGGQNQQQNQQRQQRDRDWFIGKGIPMTPEFEATIRQVEDEFSAQMHSLGMDQKQIGIFLEQAKLRAMEDLDKTRTATDEASIGAGGFNSGVRAAAQGEVSSDFGRSMQDLSQDAVQKYADVATGRAQARMDRRAAIQEALLARTAAAEADPSSPIYSGRRRTRTGNKGKRRKSRGN